jgi:hypothetical protein
MIFSRRESVVQATKTARNSLLRYYIGTIFAILFFGGFFVRSYYEEHVFKRDTERVLAYYKHILPGSMHDGDVDGARYVVWKYRSKKEQLWRLLEKKYEVPVRQADEWADYDDGKGSTDDEETLDLDDIPEEEKADADSKGEPDL